MASSEDLTQHSLEQLRAIAAAVLERPVPPLSVETEIRALGVDSIALAEIIARLEDELAIEVPAATWLSMKTLGDLVTIVERARAT